MERWPNPWKVAAAAYPVAAAIFTAGFQIVREQENPPIPHAIGWTLVVVAAAVAIVPIVYVAAIYGLRGFRNVRSDVRVRRGRRIGSEIQAGFAVTRSYIALARSERILERMIETGCYWPTEAEGPWLGGWRWDQIKVRGHEAWRPFYRATHDALGEVAIIAKRAKSTGLGETVADVAFVERTLDKVRDAIRFIPDGYRARAKFDPDDPVMFPIAA